MTYCSECQTVEGETDENEDGIMVCLECDSEDSIQFVPEHDDCDLER